MSFTSLLSMARLDWTIYLSLLGAIVVVALPSDNKAALRWTALITSLLGLAFSLYAFFTYRIPAADAQDALRASFQFEVNAPWIPAIGASYHLGADGISLPLVVLTGIVAVTGTLFSWNIETRTKEFFAFFLLLIAGVYGVFLSLDVLLLFLFYELAIIPKYFLIAIWGSNKGRGREYAAMKLVMYSFAGSSLVFAGILAMYVGAGAHTFDMLELKRALPVELHQFCFPLVFLGFGVLAGMWPFHTWAPTGHSAAPTAASMLLAGVVMKLGAYGCLRVGVFLLPEALKVHGGMWQWTFALLALVGILWGALVALVQRDFKYVIGYSSVSHMGFVLLGLMTLDVVGVDGGVLQMFAHGVVASLLFAVVGRMVHDRTHTRDLGELGTMRLARQMPFVATVFIIGGLASMGLPGLSGFVAELQVLMGAWDTLPWLAIASGVGIVVTVWYTFRTILQAFYGSPSSSPVPAGEPLSPLTWQERTAALVLVALLFVVGLYPALLLDMIDRSVALLLRS